MPNSGGKSEYNVAIYGTGGTAAMTTTTNTAIPPRTGGLRVVSLNLNGVRAAFRKGLEEWLNACAPDLVCVQELKAQQRDLTVQTTTPAGLRGYFAHAARPGYSGVGIYARRPPQAVSKSFGVAGIDDEGRFIRLDYPRYSVVSLYLPSGSSGEQRQAFKYDIMDAVYAKLDDYRREAAADGRLFLLCGDLNIAHTEKDIRNWRGNRKNSGFLPEEREWFGRVLNDLQWDDVFRRLNNNDGEYTWWSNRGRAWENNVGWRIDYQLATPALANKAVRTFIYREQRFSDHAPLVIDYRIRR